MAKAFGVGWHIAMAAARDHGRNRVDDPARMRSRLPDATLVVDHFHAVRLANAAIDEIRRRVQQEQTGHRGRAGDPSTASDASCWSVPSVFLSEAGPHIHAGLAAGDPEDEVSAPLVAKELLRDVYSAPGARSALGA